MPFYLTPKQDDFDKIPELQVRIAEALYDAEAVLSNPRAFKAEEIRTLRDQITSNLERAWEFTGRSEDELTGVMVQISRVVAKQLSDEKRPVRRVRLAITLFEIIALQSRAPRHLDIAAAVFTPCLTPTD